MQQVPISEIFVSPQGEGLTTGLMTLFVRVGGCNLALDGSPCKWCDTPYAWKSTKNQYLQDTELKNIVEKIMIISDLREISLTGGEPLLFEEQLIPLINYWKRKYHLVIETNGTFPIWKDSHIMFSVDLKCPSSGNSNFNLYDNLSLLAYKDQLKCVIATKEDFDFALNVVNSMAVLTNIFFQPAYKLLSHAQLIAWLRDSKNTGRIRVGTQCQKVWYPRRKKGI